jgi:hypothetical protein
LILQAGLKRAGVYLSMRAPTRRLDSYPEPEKGVCRGLIHQARGSDKSDPYRDPLFKSKIANG